MTEEKMIRVSDMPEYNLKFAEARIYYSHDGYVKSKDMMVETIAINELMEIAPAHYVIEYGDGDEEDFFAKDDTHKFMMAWALATEHYWFYDREEVNKLLEDEIIKLKNWRVENDL